MHPFVLDLINFRPSLSEKEKELLEYVLNFWQQEYIFPPDEFRKSFCNFKEIQFLASSLDFSSPDFTERGTEYCTRVYLLIGEKYTTRDFNSVYHAGLKTLDRMILIQNTYCTLLNIKPIVSPQQIIHLKNLSKGYPDSRRNRLLGPEFRREDFLDLLGED